MELSRDIDADLGRTAAELRKTLDAGDIAVLDQGWARVKQELSALGIDCSTPEFRLTWLAAAAWVSSVLGLDRRRDEELRRMATAFAWWTWREDER